MHILPFPKSSPRGLSPYNPTDARSFRCLNTIGVNWRAVFRVMDEGCEPLLHDAVMVEKFWIAQLAAPIGFLPPPPPPPAPSLLAWLVSLASAMPERLQVGAFYPESRSN